MTRDGSGKFFHECVTKARSRENGMLGQVKSNYSSAIYSSACYSRSLRYLALRHDNMVEAQ